MNKVIRLKRPKNINAFKIEGELFENIRSANRDIDNITKKLRTYHMKMMREINKLKEDQWNAIYKETGLKSSDNLALETDCEDLGFYLVKRVKRPIWMDNED